MAGFKIQQIFKEGWSEYSKTHKCSKEQMNAAYSIQYCKTGRFGQNYFQCDECGHIEIHNNSCRNRNCPNCQAVLKEIWIDERRSEVFDMPYFHTVFTLPAELNPLIYANQKKLYSLMHKCSSETLLELSRDKKYLGATPSIIQVLHTWGQTLNYHPHIHCIVSGGGLTPDLKLKKSGEHFFLPVHVMAALFRGKFLDGLKKLKIKDELVFSESCKSLKEPKKWKAFIDKLYKTQWCPYTKETFNGYGNAIEYLGRYSHKIAITNSRIVKVDESNTTFKAKNYKTGETEQHTISCVEFIRRYLMHVLPSGFQKIRYYGLLSPRSKKLNLKLVFELQGHQQFKALLRNCSKAEIIQKIWKLDITVCPHCGSKSMSHLMTTHSGFA